MASFRKRNGVKWKVREPQRDLWEPMAASLDISPLTCRILINRGISDVEQAGRFLSSTLSDLRSPLDMKGMKQGVDRVISALHNKEKIAIFGDYDVDGITSTSILYLFFQSINGNVSYHIPDRMTEGYGLNPDALRRLAGEGVRLLITADCGISNSAEVEVANGLGMDVIITDHHEVPDLLPPALAVINPKQHDCPFPFKHLAGVGVAFNLIIALRARLRDEGFWREAEVPNLKEYLDLVALGTIADVVPLVDENRIFVKYGLAELTESKKPGIKALKEVSGIGDAPIRADMVGYRLAPRINAAGRIGKGSDGVRLLTSGDYAEALEIAKLLDEENRKRQALEEEILRDATAMLEAAPPPAGARTIVLASQKWHQGVIGIVASRIADAYYRPTVLISLRDGMGKGSARSIHSFMLYDGLKACSHLLEAYGGHEYAAGLSIKEENLKQFAEEFEKTASTRLTDEDLIPELEIDAVMDLKEISEGLINELEALSPFGEANPEPVICTRGLDVADCRIVGSNHLKLKLKQSGVMRDAIGFGMGEGAERFSSSDGLDVAFIPQINKWNGGKSIQLKLKDIKTV